jgi:hypothetical protein
MMNEIDGEEIIRARLGGESERAIARRLKITLADVRDALDRFSATVINHHTRLHTLALDLERLDEMITAFRPMAKGGDVQAGARRSSDPGQPGAAGEEFDPPDRGGHRSAVPRGPGEAAGGRLMEERDIEAAIAAASTCGC